MGAQIKPHTPRLDYQHPLARGIWAAWPFSGVRGTVVDLVSGVAATVGSSAAAPADVVDKHGGAIEFDLDVGTGLNTNRTLPAIGVGDSLTIAVLVKEPTYSNNASAATIIGNRYEGTESPLQFLKLDAGGGSQFYHESAGAQGQTWSLTVGEWQWLVFVKRPGETETFLGGVSQGTTAVTEGLDPNPVYLGAGDAAGTTEAADILIADARIWTRELTHSEILGLIVDPWAMYRRAPALRSLVSSEPASGAKSATSSVTLPVPTSDASGTVASDASNAGTSAITLPVPVSTATGSTGVAIEFVGTQTTGPAPHRWHAKLSPYPDFNDARDLGYRWEVSSNGGSTWTPIVKGPTPQCAGVFRTPGTYLVRCVANSNASTEVLDVTSDSLTVQDPDTVYSGTDTLCVSASGTSTGAPAGADTLATTNPRHATIIAAWQAGKRVLFHRGETFPTVGSGTTSLGECAAGAMIGAFGTEGTRNARGIDSNAPVIDGSSIGNGEWLLTLRGQGIKITDVVFTESSGNGADCLGMEQGSGTLEDFLLDRVRFDESWNACLVGPDDSDMDWAGVTFSSCEFDDPDGYGYYGNVEFFSVIDCLFDGAGDHNFRVPQTRDFVSYGCDYGDAGVHAIKLHSNGTAAGEISERIYIWDCDRVKNWAFGPQNASSNESVNDIVLFNNRSTQEGVDVFGCKNVEIQNEVCNYAGSYAYPLMVSVSTRGVEQSPGNVRVINPTFRDQAGVTDETYLLTHDGTADQNVILHAPLMYSDATTNAGFTSGSSITLTEEFGPTTNPSFVSSSDLNLQSGSSALGTVNTTPRPVYDAAGNFRPTSTWDPGAFEESPDTGGSIAGSSSIVLPVVSSDAEATAASTFSGMSSVTLPVPVLQASGNASTAIAGSSSITLPVPVSTARGTGSGGADARGAIGLPGGPGSLMVR